MMKKFRPSTPPLELLLVLVLVLGPQLTQCLQPPVLDPAMSLECPAPGCGRGASIAPTASEKCCYTCANYTSSGCNAVCLRQNFTSLPCSDTCGAAGCKRAACGEPVDSGKQCCSPRLVAGCPSAQQVYLNADCCPVCHNATGTAPPDSPSHCHFNMTRGVGQPVCDRATEQCSLAPVSDWKDIGQFNFTMMLQVCSEAELAPLMQLMAMGSANMMMAGPAAGGAGPADMPMPTGLPNLANMKAAMEQFAALANNFTKMKDVAGNITSPTCREPILCIAKMYGNMVPILNDLIGPILAQLKSPSASLNQAQLLNLMPVMGNFSTRLTEILVKGATCMKSVQLKTPCVSKALAMNMQDLAQASCCNLSDPADLSVLKRLSGQVSNDSVRNEPPGVRTLAALNCSDLTNQCALSFVSNLLQRTADKCADFSLPSAARDNLRGLLFRCTGGPENLTHAGLVSALFGCLLTGEDVRRIGATMPSKLKDVLQDVTGTNPGCQASTVGARVQKSLMNTCPDVKVAVDKALAKAIDFSRLTVSDVAQMVNMIRADKLAQIPPAVWQAVGQEALAQISRKLLDDPDRDSKCRELVRIANQSLLANLSACVAQMKPELLRLLFGSGPELQTAIGAFNVSKMMPNDLARNTPVLRDLLKDVTANADNCLTYMNSLFSFRREKIDPGLCRNDTCYKQMCDIMPDHANTVHCRELRPPPTASSIAGLGASAMAQLTPAEVRDALSGATDAASIIQSLVTHFADTGSSSGGSSAASGFDERLSAMKRKSVVSAVMEKFQSSFLASASLISSFSAADFDASILCQLNSQQLRQLPCAQMPTVAYRAGAYVGSLSRGAGRAVVQCVCQLNSNCSSITSSGISQMSSYVLFINETELANLPTAALAVFCRSLQSVSVSEKSRKMPMALQRAAHAKCVGSVDMTSVGGPNVTDVSSLTTWNLTIVKAVMVCALTTAEISKLDQDAAEYLVSVLPGCPFDEAWLRAVCTRLFKLYNDSATSGNYSLSTIGMCSTHLASGLANTSKVSREDVRTNAGAVSAAFRANADACFVRASNGLQSDCAASTDAAAGRAYRAALSTLETGSPVAAAGRRRRRRREASAPLTCSDIQNLASGVAQVTAAQIQAMQPSEFQTCFSTFGIADANWSSDQCSQLKAQTEAAYNATSMWTSSVLLTVGCLTQCWSASEIASIPYSDVAHISDIGKYCKMMPKEAKMATVSAYISRVKANNSALMSRTELSSLGYLACGADSTLVDNFNHTHVLNSLTELGTPGPCDAAVMQSYVARVKLALGASVTTWQASYFTGLANLISGLTSSDIPTLLSSQIGYIDASVISGITVSKFKVFTSTQLASFSASQRSAVTSAQLAELTDSQKAALGITVTSGAGWLMTNAFLLLGCLASSAAAGRLSL